jgi:hypothetical protein
MGWRAVKKVVAGTTATTATTATMATTVRAVRTAMMARTVRTATTATTVATVTTVRAVKWKWMALKLGAAVMYRALYLVLGRLDQVGLLSITAKVVFRVVGVEQTCKKLKSSIRMELH